MLDDKADDAGGNSLITVFNPFKYQFRTHFFNIFACYQMGMVRKIYISLICTFLTFSFKFCGKCHFEYDLRMIFVPSCKPVEISYYIIASIVNKMAFRYYYMTKFKTY